MKSFFTFIFTLIFVFSAASLFGQNVIQVSAGQNQIGAAYLSASSGDILELITDGGLYQEDSTLKTTFPITIRAAAGLSDKPVWETSDRHVIDLGDSLWLSGFKMTGMYSDEVDDIKDSTKYAIAENEGVVDSGYILIVDDVDFDFFQITEDGELQGYVFRPETAEYAERLVFKNCTFTRVSSYVFRFRSATVAPAQFGLIEIENCTAADIGSYFLRADMLTTETDTAKVRINHCTFYDIGNDVVRIDDEVGDVDVRNSIFYDTGDIVDAEDGVVTYCDTLLTGGFNIDNESAVIENIYAEDPEFADADNFDFTVSSIFASIAIGSDGKVVGDLRWDPAATSIEKEGNNPQIFALSQNYPNPFNPTTKIAYQLPRAVDVKLSIYNVLGQEVIRLVDENQKAGNYEIVWYGKDKYEKVISSGIYFFRIQAGDFVQTRKMTFLK